MCAIIYSRELRSEGHYISLYSAEWTDRRGRHWNMQKSWVYETLEGGEMKGWTTSIDAMVE